MAAVAATRAGFLGRPAAADALLGGGLAVAAAAELASSDPVQAPVAVAAVVLATTVPLAWRTSIPLAVVLLAVAAVAVEAAVGSTQDVPLLTWLAIGVGLYSLGEHGSNRQVAIGGAVAGAGYAAFGAIDDDAGSAAFGGFLALGTLAVGRAVRVMGLESDRLEARIDVLQVEQETRAREAVNAERDRIARELHDVIGHSISVMGVQAGAVRRVLPPELEEEREALLSVERAGRDAVTEMRRLLGLLKSPDEGPSGALPDLVQVPRLVQDMRGAGLSIDLDTDGDLHAVPPGRSLAAYRIVQEALTNALKHSPGAAVRVSIRRTPRHVEIEVLQAGGAPRASLASRDGHTGQGLVGMRERVTLYGGRLRAAPGAAGGFEVQAELPLQGGVE